MTVIDTQVALEQDATAGLATSTRTTARRTPLILQLLAGGLGATLLALAVLALAGHPAASTGPATTAAAAAVTTNTEGITS